MWQPDKSEDELVSCTIITGEPNDRVATLHDRMPVMLPPDRWSTWLDPEQRVVPTFQIVAPLPALRGAMRPGGVLRLSTPNLDWVMETQYTAGRYEVCKSIVFADFHE